MPGGTYQLAQKPGNFGWKPNGTVTFRKIRSEIVYYLESKSSFSIRNGTEEISLPLEKLSSFQSLISRKQLRGIELQMASAISLGGFADFGKALIIIVPIGLFWEMVSTPAVKIDQSS